MHEVHYDGCSRNLQETSTSIAPIVIAKLIGRLESLSGLIVMRLRCDAIDIYILFGDVADVLILGKSDSANR